MADEKKTVKVTADVDIQMKTDAIKKAEAELEKAKTTIQQLQEREAVLVKIDNKTIDQLKEYRSILSEIVNLQRNMGTLNKAVEEAKKKVPTTITPATTKVASRPSSKDYVEEYYDKEYQRDLEAYHKKNKELMTERDAQAKRAMEAQLAGDKAQKAVAELKQKQAEEELKSLQRPMHESERKKRVEANAQILRSSKDITDKSTLREWRQAKSQDIEALRGETKTFVPRIKRKAYLYREGTAKDSTQPIITSRAFGSFVTTDKNGVQTVIPRSYRDETGAARPNLTAAIRSESGMQVSSALAKEVGIVDYNRKPITNFNNQSLFQLNNFVEKLASVPETSLFYKAAQEAINDILTTIEQAFNNTLEPNLRKLLTGKIAVAENAFMDENGNYIKKVDAGGLFDREQANIEAGLSGANQFDQTRGLSTLRDMLLSRKGAVAQTLSDIRVRWDNGDQLGETDNQSAGEHQSQYSDQQKRSQESTKLNKLIEEKLASMPIQKEVLDMVRNWSEKDNEGRTAEAVEEILGYALQQAYEEGYKGAAITAQDIVERLNPELAQNLGITGRDVYTGVSEENLALQNQASANSLDAPKKYSNGDMGTSKVNNLSDETADFQQQLDEVDEQQVAEIKSNLNEVKLIYDAIVTWIKNFQEKVEAGEANPQGIKAAFDSLMDGYIDVVNSTSDLKPEDAQNLLKMFENAKSLMQKFYSAASSPEEGLSNAANKFGYKKNRQFVMGNLYGTDNDFGYSSWATNKEAFYSKAYGADFEYGKSKDDGEVEATFSESAIQALDRTITKNEGKGNDDTSSKVVAAAEKVAAMIDKAGGNGYAFANLGNKRTNSSTAYNQLANLLYYPEMVELSAQKKASSINGQAGKEVVSADKLIEQWKANNPRLGEKYDLLKEGRSKFDKEMKDGDIDKALEKFFETGYTPVQKLKNLYESLTTKITTIGKGIDEYTGEEIDIPVQRSEQDIFKQNLLGRLSTDADENPNKYSVSYYQKNGIKGEGTHNTPLEDVELSNVAKTQLLYHAGYTGTIYGGSTIEDQLTNAQKEREQIEQDLLTASEDELEVKRAYYKAVCADILTLKGALEERQSKGTVKALSMEEKMALAEKKYQEAITARMNQEGNFKGLSDGRVTTEIKKEDPLTGLMNRYQSLVDSGKYYVPDESKNTAPTTVLGANGLSIETASIKDSTEAFNSHAEAVQKAVQAEKDKLEVAGKLSEALKVEGEAAKESELPFTFGGETVSVATGNDNSELRRDIQVLQEQVKEYEQRIDELEEGGNRSPNVEAPRDQSNLPYNGRRFRNDSVDPALRAPRNLDNLFNEQENNTAVHEGQYNLIGQMKDFESNLRSALKTYGKFAEVTLKIKTLEEERSNLIGSDNEENQVRLATLERELQVLNSQKDSLEETYQAQVDAADRTGIQDKLHNLELPTPFNQQAAQLIQNFLSGLQTAYDTAQAKQQQEVAQLKQADALKKNYLKSLKEQQKIERDMLTLQNSMDDQVGPRSKEQQKLVEMYQSRLQAIKNQTVSYDSNTGKFSDGTQLSEQERLQFNKQIENSQASQEEKLAKINLRQKESVGLIQQIANGFKASLRNLTDYSLAYVAIGYIKNSLQQVWQYTKDLDAAMVDLQIAAGMGYSDVKNMMYEFNNLAKEVGKSTQEVAVAANDWLRAGYQGKEASDLTKASMYLSTLGMIESADATSYLISVLKGWKIEASEVMSVVDRLSAVDMAAAASAGGIAEAMSRANNSAQLANTEMNRFIGYVTTMIDVTQKSEASIGESMKSLYARYQNVAAGKFVAAQEDIESENYNAEDWARLNDVETALGAMGIQLRDTVSTFRSFDDVLDEIASKWDTYSTVQQAGIATSLAGTRQRENLVAMLSNWDSVLKYQEIASNSYGTAVEKMESYTNSIEAAQKRIQVAAEKLTLNVNLQGVQKKLYNTIAEVIYNLDKFGLAIIAIAAIMNSNSLINVASNWYGKISDIISSAGQLTYGIGRINTSEGREYLGKQLDEYKEYAEENFIVSQQKRYGAALSQATKGAQEVTQSYLLSAQSALLNESQDKQAAVAKELLTGTITEETVASLSRESLNALTMNVSEQRLASMQHQIAVEQGMITQDQTLTAEQAKLVETKARQRLAAEELTQQEQKYKTALGKNLGKSSTQSYSQSLVAGAGTIVGGLLGTTTGGNIGKNFGEGGQLVGSMLGAMLIGQVGGKFGTRLSDSISKGISNYKAYAKEGLTASEAFNREFANSAKHSSKAFWSALASPQLVTDAAVLFAAIVYNAYVSSLKAATEKAQEEFKKATELYDSAQSASANAIKFDELANGVDYLGRNVSLTSEEYDKFLELSNDIAEVFPELVVRTDEFGNKLVGPEGIEGRVSKVTEAINDLTDSAEKAANVALFKNPDGISAALHKIFTGFSVSPFGVDLESTIEEYKKARTNEIKLQGQIFGAEQTLSTMSPEEAGYEEQRKNINAWKDELETQQKQIKRLNQQLSDYNSQLVSSADYIAEYAQYTGLSDRMSSLATDENNMVSALVQSSQATINRRLSQGTINEEGYKEQVLKVTDAMTKLLEEHPVIADVYYRTDDATLASEAVALKDSFKDALIEAFMSDGMVSVEENELLLSLGLKYDAQSGKAVVLTLQEQIQEAIKGALGEDVTVSSSVNNLLNQLSSEDFGKVTKMANSGWIGRTTEDVDIIRMINADRTYDSEVGYFNRAQQKQDSYDSLQDRLKSYYSDVIRGKKEGSNEEIGKEFSDLPENVRNAVVASSEELKKFEGSVKEMQEAVQDAVYDTAWQQLASIQEDLSKVAEFKLSDAFGDIDGVEGVATTWAELKAVVDAVKDSYDTLSAAQKEQDAYGKLSTQTVISMLAENENYIELLDTSTGSLKLKANATQEMTRIQLEALKANMEAANAEDEMTKAQLEREWQELELSKTSGTATNEKIQANNNEIVSNNDLTKSYTELYASIQAVNMAKTGNIKGAEQMMNNKKAMVEAAGTVEQTDATYKVDTTYIEARQKYIQDQMGEWDPDEGFANNGRLQQRIDARKIIMNDLQEMIDKGLDLGKDSTGFFTPDLSNLKDANEELEKFLSALEGIYNKEYYLMQAFKTIGEDINATSQDMYMGANYYGLNNGKDYDKLAKVYEQQMKLYAPLANEETTEGLGYLQKYQEAYVKLKNLDDERVQDKINILQLQDVSYDQLIAAQEELIKTSDTLEEQITRENELNNLIKQRYELYRDIASWQREMLDIALEYESGSPDTAGYADLVSQKKQNLENEMEAVKQRMAEIQDSDRKDKQEELRNLAKQYAELYKEYATVDIDVLNDKLDVLERRLDLLEKSKPQEWAKYDDIAPYYQQNIGYLEQKAALIREQLEDVSMLTDEQVQNLVDQLNDVTVALHEAQMQMLEDQKNYKESQYNALVSKVQEYITELEDAMDEIEKAYEDELKPLEQANEERERAIKLEELLAAKKRAAQEKERVFRVGVGWVYESPRSKQREAQKDLDDFKRQDKIDDLTGTKDAEKEALQERIDNLNLYLKALEWSWNEAERIERDRLLAEMMNIDQSLSNEEIQKEMRQRIMDDMQNFIEVQNNDYQNYLGIFSSFINSYTQLVLQLAELQRQALSLINSSQYLGLNAGGSFSITDAIGGGGFGNALDRLDSGVDYSRNFQAEINAALKDPRNYGPDGQLSAQGKAHLAKLEKYRNEKIDLGLGGNYEKTYNYTSGFSSGGGSGKSSGGSGNKTSSSSPYNSKTDYNNESKYLDNLIKNGSAGQKAWAQNQKKELDKAQKGYADGIENGPVTYTGLSMLHGTYSKPEYVLNSDQAYNLLRNLATTKLPEYTSTLSQDMGVSYVIQGDVVLENCDDPAQFWNQVMAATHNRYNVTKNKR